MALEFVEESFFAQIDYSPGNYWLTDFSSAPGSPQAINLPLPSWWPSVVHLSSIWAWRKPSDFGTNGFTNAGNLGVHMDVGRIAYTRGRPSSHQQNPWLPGGNTDYRQFNTLVWVNQNEFDKERRFGPYARRLDRSASSLWIQPDGGVAGTIQLCIRRLIPAPDQPAADTGAYVPYPSDPIASATPGTTKGAGFGYTNIDRSVIVPSGSVVTALWAYSLSPVTLTPKLVNEASGVGNVLVSLGPQSHPGGGWASFLVSPAVTLTAACFPGYYSAAQIESNGSTPRAYASGDVTGSGIAFTEDTSNAAAAGASV